MADKGCIGLMSTSTRCAAVIGMCLAALLPAYAELQNVEIGGEIKIRGRYWMNTYANHVNSNPVAPFAGKFLGRALGPWGLASRYDWDDDGANLKYWEQKSKLHVRADFTNDVSGVMTIEVCDMWGEDFRSDYLTGLDSRQATSSGIEFTAAYVEARDMWNSKLDLRIGRQPIKLGKGWLVGDQISGTIALFFDGIRATYDADDFVIDAWWTKLDENSPAEEDGDVDFYGLVGTYKGWESITLSAYWLWVRDARAVHDSSGSWIEEALERVLGVDQYGNTDLHTIGLRLNGQYNAWDYDWELAYQFGDAAQVGHMYAPFMYGDDEAEFDAWGSDLEVGYTFDVRFNPRVYLGGAYFSGNDERRFSMWRSDASAAFNRLFSAGVYSWILDIGQDFSNFYQIRAGIDARFTEKLAGRLQLAYFGVNEPTKIPWTVNFAGRPYALFPDWPFFAEDADSSIGTLLFASLKYNYSDDLYISFVCEHLFTDDGLTRGNFLHRNGLEFSGGTDDKDASFFMIETGLKF